MICDDCQKQDGCQYLPMVLDGEEICSSFFPRGVPRVVQEGKEIRGNTTKPPTTAKPNIHPPGVMTINEAKKYFMPDAGSQKDSGDIILDSGQRTSFPTGAVRDMHAGKGRMDLLPWAAIMEVSIHCERGAKKYGERNIDKGVPMHSLLDSALRHLAKYMEGAKDEPHLVAAAWNLLWAVQFEKVKPEMQDIPGREP